MNSVPSAFKRLAAGFAVTATVFVLFTIPGIAVVPGFNGKIAFARMGQIWVMNSDGTGQTEVTYEGENADPAWSPDGTMIAFVRGSISPPSPPLLYVMKADGTGVTQLSHGFSSAGSPAWSPDGRKLAFEGVKFSFTIDIYVTNADGTGATALTSDGDNSEPAWSPDGKKIAFLKKGIWVMNADGSGQKSLSTLGVDPAWSPDGRKLAFSDGARIWMMNSDGTGLYLQTTKTNAPACGGECAGAFGVSDRHPAWSPDGTRIAFESNRGFYGICDTDIFVMSAASPESASNAPADWSRLGGTAGPAHPDWAALTFTRSPR